MPQYPRYYVLLPYFCPNFNYRDKFCPKLTYLTIKPNPTCRLISPNEYLLSSYKAYCGQQEQPAWLHTNEILLRIGGKKELQKFVENPNQPSLKEFYNGKYIPSVLGSKMFQRHILTHFSFQQRRESLAQRLPLAKLCYMVVKHFNNNETVENRAVKQSRNIAMTIARRYGHNLQDIASHYQLSQAAVSIAVKQTKETLSRLPTFKKQLADFERLIEMEFKFKL